MQFAENVPLTISSNFPFHFPFGLVLVGIWGKVVAASIIFIIAEILLLSGVVVGRRVILLKLRSIVDVFAKFVGPRRTAREEEAVALVRSIVLDAILSIEYPTKVVLSGIAGWREIPLHDDDAAEEEED